ncbi:MAG: hypothetical protein QF464_05595, partial [Myxococcota bacterium]|nr:hypothetical protein [Myxococcota bacterium]
LLAIPAVFGADIVITSKVLSFLGYLAVIVGVFRLIRLLVPASARLVPAMGAVMAAAATPLGYWGMIGMEMTLYLALLLAALHAYLSSVLRGERGRAWCLIFAVLALTRPEGFAFFGLLVGLDAARELWVTRQPVATLRRVGFHLGWFAVIFGPFLLFRLAYFGELLPNTVAAKSGFSAHLKAMPIMKALGILWEGRGVENTVEFTTRLFGYVGILTLPAFLVRSTRYANLTLWAVSSGVVAVCIWNRGGWMAHYRLMLPMLPLVIISICLGLSACVRLCRDHTAAQRVASIACLAVMALSAHQLYYNHEPSKHSKGAVYLNDLGAAVGAHADPDDLMAADMAGRIPFYAKVRTIDTFGLCDRHIAHHGTGRSRMGKTDWPYVFSKRPTFYYYNFGSGVRDMYKHAAFRDQRKDYWLVTTPHYRRVRYRSKKMLLIRKDWPHLDAFAAAMDVTYVEPVKELKRLRVW